MSEPINLAAQSARFSDAVRAFAPVCASRYAKLLPFKDGIVELRQKGASYRLIRELLATVGVAVAVDTIGNFVREVVEQRAAARPSPRWRPVRPLSEASVAASVPTPSKPQFPFTLSPPVEVAVAEGTPSVSDAAAAASPTTERPRSRGPRIADPANL
jgi:hypothetical protein